MKSWICIACEGDSLAIVVDEGLDGFWRQEWIGAFQKIAIACVGLLVMGSFLCPVQVLRLRSHWRH
jgi:hypothetical protein